MFSSPRGRKGRLAGLAAAIPIALAVLAGSALPASALPEPVTYVALGDSYSAGQGSIPSETAKPPCNRSPLGYPTLLDARADVDQLADLTCAGFGTRELIAALPVAPDRSIRLVTLTIGGNDLGFSQLAPECPFTPEAAGCSDILTVTPQEIADLTAALETAYRAVKDAYPKARVVVLGYPRLFPSSLETGHPLSRFIQMINAGSDVLQGAIVAATKRAHVAFVDVRDEFAGHEALTAAAWISFGVPDPLANLHPSPEGYRLGYYQALVNDKVVKD